jgi:hypothetical protein
MPLHVSGVTRPSSGSSAQMLFGVTACVHVGCVLTACKLRFHRNLHAVNTHPKHAITPNSICAELPEDVRVTAETCRGIVSLQNNIRKVYQVGVYSLRYHNARSTKQQICTTHSNFPIDLHTINLQIYLKITISMIDNNYCLFISDKSIVYCVMNKHIYLL